MTSYRKPETAPRDGTNIMGLWKVGERRAVRCVGFFDTERMDELIDNPAPDAAPQWVKDGEAEDRRRLINGPVSFFRPSSDDEGLLGARLVGWRSL